MVRLRRSSGQPRRRRIGHVSYYVRHGSWHIYYRDGARQVRRKVGETEEIAAQTAALVNAQLTASAPTLFSFTPVPIAELRQRFLDHHELVLRSSLATVRRYRTATQHLEEFARISGRTNKPAHELDAEQFVRHLRSIRVAPNGHAHTARRPLRDKGIRFILETCRSMFGFAAKKRHLPPYGENPFAGLGGKRFSVEDAKRIFVFDAATELAFFQAADSWSFPIHFTLAKAGIRLGELVHLVVEDLDLERGWMTISNKPDLGWKIKTRRERIVPLIDELVSILRVVIGERKGGPVFLRQTFDPSSSELTNATRDQLGRMVEQRIDTAERECASALTRERQLAIAKTVWKDAGAIKADRVRQSFIRVAQSAGIPGTTCPKSWRHTFATLLQDANVDPLIRQLTMGHAPSGSASGGLGMTAVYTHTRPETLRREIVRAMKLWPRTLELSHAFVRDWTKD